MTIDAHAHIGGPPPEIEPENFVKLLDRCKIDKAIVCRYLEGKPLWDGNELVASAVNVHPDRIIGFLWLDPNAKNIRDDIEKAIRLRFKGIKIHLEIHPTSMKKLSSVFVTAIEHGMPIYAHLGDDFEVIDELCQNYQDIDLIVGHLGTGVYNLDPKRLEKSLLLAEKHKNIFLETSGNTYPFVKRAVNRVGADKIVFGTDVPHTHPLVELKMIEILELPKIEEEKILSRNILWILEK